MVDCVEYVNKALNKVTTKAYSDMAKMPIGFGKKYITVLKKVPLQK